MDLYYNFGNSTEKLNIYDIFGYCFPNDDFDKMIGYSVNGGKINKYKKGYTMLDYTPWLKKKHQNLGIVPPCVFGGPILDYLNREDVRAALHIPNEYKAWDMCND